MLEHAGNTVRNFHAHLALPVRVGIEATGPMHWFLELMEQLGIECQVGHPAKISRKVSQLPCNEFFSEMADLPLWLGVQNVGLRHSKQLQYHNVATRKNDYGGRFRCSQEQQTLEN